MAKAHPSTGDSLPRWKPGATAQPAGSPTGQRGSFAGNSVGLNLVQAAQLVFASSRPIVWPESLQLVCLRVTLGSLYCLLWQGQRSLNLV